MKPADRAVVEAMKRNIGLERLIRMCPNTEGQHRQLCRIAIKELRQELDERRRADGQKG